MEPMMPGSCRALDDKTVVLIEKSRAFAGMLNNDVTQAVGDLVRSMNCYYSNFSNYSAPVIKAGFFPSNFGIQNQGQQNQGQRFTL